MQSDLSGVNVATLMMVMEGDQASKYHGKLESLSGWAAHSNPFLMIASSTCSAFVADAS